MNGRSWRLGLAALAATVVMTGCYGTGATYVGVYGPPVYGPSPWGGYPYPGRYPPYGGGVWVGVCCEEQEEQEEQLPEAPEPGASDERSEPTITIQENIER